MLKQKNAALKKESYDQIKLWNMQLSEVAVKIVEFRIEALRMLNKELNENSRDILPNYTNNIEILYNMTRLEGVFNVETYQETLLEKFKEDSFKEKALCYSLVGPQRDDFEIQIGGKELYSIFSRGINRTMAILVKMAQLICIQKKLNRFPLLLLDEVFAELDNEKKKELIPFLTERAQCIFASIQKEDSVFFEHVNMFEMKNGELISHG